MPPFTVTMRRLALAGLSLAALASVAESRTVSAFDPYAESTPGMRPAAAYAASRSLAGSFSATIETAPAAHASAPIFARAAQMAQAGAVTALLPHTTLASIKFAAQTADIGSAGRAELDRIVQGSKSMSVIELRAYAAGSDATEARKIALARALTVRSYLIDQGLKMRIEVGAFASNAAGSDSERVDVVAP